jgi:hypothetical protein
MMQHGSSFSGNGEGGYYSAVAKEKETKGRRRGKIMKKKRSEGVGRCLGLKLRGMLR